MDEEEKAAGVAIALQGTAKAYYGMDLSTEAILLYHDALRAFDLDSIAAALRKHSCTPVRCRFFPKPGDLIELLQPSVEEQASAAWQTVERAVRTQGKYASVCFEDQSTRDVVQLMGGWVYMCSAANEREMEHRRMAFVRHYQAIHNRVPQVARASDVARLPGLIELAGQVQEASTQRPRTPTTSLLASGDKTL